MRYPSVSPCCKRIADVTFEEFAKNQTIVKAVLYDFVVIGEACRNIPNDIQSRYPLIPWRLMGGMRNVVTHEYFQVDLNRVRNKSLQQNVLNNCKLDTELHD